jgi:hypothetical protein
MYDSKVTCVDVDQELCKIIKNMSSSAMYTIHCQQNRISSWKHKKYHQYITLPIPATTRKILFCLEETTVNLTHETDQ